MSSLKIGIIGGSIAGCAAAIMLQRMQHQVIVFEQSSGELKDRGAGICIDKELHQQLIAQDYVDADMPYTELKSRPFYEGSSGRLLWEQPISAIALNWGLLYRNLRQRVCNDHYYQSAEIIDILTQDDHVHLTLADGRQFTVDVLICADGFYSRGRRLLFPKQEIRSVNYIAWRGLLPIGKVQVNDEYWQRIPYYCFPSGQMLLYYIPDFQDRDSYLFNWIIYHHLPYDEIQRVMTDRYGMFHQYTLPSGMMSTPVQHYLRELAAHYGPPHMADVVKRTTKPFIQHIYEINLPYLRQGRILLLGDAGILTRPHAASGAIKALQAVFLLRNLMQQEDSIDEVLTHWNQQQLESEQLIYRLGQSFGQALVEQAPPWNEMNADKMEKWWDAAIQGRQWYVTILDE